MAATTTAFLPGGHVSSSGPELTQTAAEFAFDLGLKRRIEPAAGHALELLGHAIDYLVDQHWHDGGAFDDMDPEMQAIQLLAEIDRKIYFQCPPVPTLWERCLAWLGLRSA